MGWLMDQTYYEWYECDVNIVRIYSLQPVHIFQRNVVSMNEAKYMLNFNIVDSIMYV